MRCSLNPPSKCSTGQRTQIFGEAKLNYPHNPSSGNLPQMLQIETTVNPIKVTSLLVIQRVPVTLLTEFLSLQGILKGRKEVV